MSGAPLPTAPFLASVAVLAAAGGAKLRRPDYTARALRIAGIRAGRRLVRLGAAGEIALAVAAVAAPGVVTGSLVAACYAGFAVFVGAALHRGWPLSSCGCFGRPDSRPRFPHLLLDLGAAAAAVWWAVEAPGATGRIFVHQPWHGAPLGLVSAVIAALALLVWNDPLSEARA